MNTTQHSRRPSNASAIERAGLGCVVCALPTNVLLLTGYWPIVGTSIVVAGAGGTVALIVPEDERQLAQRCGADELLTFEPGSLDAIYPLTAAVRPLLKRAIAKVDEGHGRVGYEAGACVEPASYIAMNGYGTSLSALLREVRPVSELVDADELLARLRSPLQPEERRRVERACDIAGRMFEAARQELREGVTEIEAAARLQGRLADPNEERSYGYVAVMSGGRAATAYGSFARSSSKRLGSGELVLVHCNSTVGGFWTDLTRTFILGQPDDRRRRMYGAMFAARDAALAAIRPGVPAADIDRAAREVMTAAGFGEAFKHPTGHGVGFAAIDHNARPRLHPKSPDVLEPGMVFNVEPGIYLEDLGGMRHCDVVHVTEDGAAVMSPFLNGVDQLLL